MGELDERERAKQRQEDVKRYRAFVEQCNRITDRDIEQNEREALRAEGGHRR